MVKFKKKCAKCQKNYVIVSNRNQYGVMCYECQKKDLEGEIKDPKIKELLSIPDRFYQENAFLRNIKVGYLRYGQLTERQIEAFKKSVAKMQEQELKTQEES